MHDVGINSIERGGVVFGILKPSAHQWSQWLQANKLYLIVLTEVHLREKIMREAVSLMFINKSAEILLVQLVEGTWTLPGGKREAGDSSYRQTLIRELSEELPQATVTMEGDEPDFSIIGFTPHSGKKILVHVFCGSIEGAVSPAAEIRQAKMIPLTNIHLYKVSELTKAIIRNVHSDV